MQGEIKPLASFEQKTTERKRMSNKLRDIVENIRRQLFYISARLTPRDGRFFQAVKIFEEVIDFSASLQYMALPNVDEKDGGKISAQQLEELAPVCNIVLKNTSLNDFVEWLTIETFGIISDKIDKHYYDISEPDSFSNFIDLAGRSLFKKSARYYIVKLLNATTYQLEGGSVLYIETEEFFPMLYGFTVDSRNPYLKARLIG